MSTLYNFEKIFSLVGQSLEEVQASEFYCSLGDPRIEESAGDKYHSFIDKGISFLFRDDRAQHIQFFSAAHDAREHYGKYDGPLPAGIQFDMTKVLVRDLLGNPDRLSRDSLRSNWDIYNQKENALHIDYDLDGKAISIVTIQPQF